MGLLVRWQIQSLCPVFNESENLVVDLTIYLCRAMLMLHMSTRPTRWWQHPGLLQNNAQVTEDLYREGEGQRTLRFRVATLIRSANRSEEDTRSLNIRPHFFWHDSSTCNHLRMC